MAEDSRLAVDRWTGATLPQASAHRVPARSKKPALRRHHGKRLAEGDLYLWEPHQLRFRRASWSVEEDEHGVWCLQSKARGLRVPLACVVEVRVASVRRLQFDVARFGREPQLTFRRASAARRLLHYWVGTLQALVAHACTVASPAVWSAEWAAVRVQAHWRGWRGRSLTTALRRHSSREAPPPASAPPPPPWTPPLSHPQGVAEPQRSPRGHPAGAAIRVASSPVSPSTHAIPPPAAAAAVVPSPPTDDAYESAVEALASRGHHHRRSHGRRLSARRDWLVRGRGDGVHAGGARRGGGDPPRYRGATTHGAAPNHGAAAAAPPPPPPRGSHR